jgi:hypothetical protein
MATKTRKTEAKNPQRSTATNVLLWGGAGGLLLYIYLKSTGGGGLSIPGIGEGGVLPAIGQGFEDLLGGSGGDPFAGLKDWIAKTLPKPQGGASGALPVITGGIKADPNQPGASSEAAGQSSLPWLPEPYSQPQFYQEEIAKAGGILGRQLLAEFTIGKSIIRPLPLRSEVQAAGKVTRAAIKSVQTALKVEKPIVLTAEKAAAYTAEKVAAKAAPKIAEEIAIKSAPKIAAEVAEKVAPKLALKTAIKAAPKIGARIASKAIPIIGWASLLADVGADISRVFGAKPTEWLGFSPLLEPILGYNPIEQWVAQSQPGYTENIAPSVSERSPRVEADLDTSTISYPVSSELPGYTRIGGNLFSNAQLDIFGQQAIEAANAYERGYALNYAEPAPAGPAPAGPAPTPSAFADLGKYIPGRWGQASLDKAAAKTTQQCTTGVCQ